MEDVREDVGEIKAGKSGRRWFAVCSDMFEHPIVGMQVRTPKPADPKRDAWPAFAAWQWLIKEAASRERAVVISGKSVTLQRGQLIHSQRHLAATWNWGRQAVREFVDRLTRFGMVETTKFSFAQNATHQATQAATVITIVNYGVYQHDRRDNNPGSNQRTTQQQPSSNPKQYIETRIQKKGDAREGAKFWKDALATCHDDVTIVDGRLTLANGARSFWLEQFGGDEKALDLALIQAFGWIKPNEGAHDLTTQVNRQLAAIARDEHGRNKRHAVSVATRQQTQPSNETPRERKIREAAEFRARRSLARQETRKP